MKINDTRKTYAVEFSTLKCGTVFIVGAVSEYYMKTEEVKDDDTLNAVCLNDGEMVYCHNSDLVIVIDCELTVK